MSKNGNLVLPHINKTWKVMKNKKTERIGLKKNSRVAVFKTSPKVNTFNTAWGHGLPLAGPTRVGPMCVDPCWGRESCRAVPPQPVRSRLEERKEECGWWGSRGRVGICVLDPERELLKSGSFEASLSGFRACRVQ